MQDDLHLYNILHAMGHSAMVGKYNEVTGKMKLSLKNRPTRGGNDQDIGQVFDGNPYADAIRSRFDMYNSDDNFVSPTMRNCYSKYNLLGFVSCRTSAETSDSRGRGGAVRGSTVDEVEDDGTEDEGEDEDDEFFKREVDRVKEQALQLQSRAVLQPSRKMSRLDVDDRRSVDGVHGDNKRARFEEVVSEEDAPTFQCVMYTVLEVPNKVEQSQEGIKQAETSLDRMVEEFNLYQRHHNVTEPQLLKHVSDTQAGTIKAIPIKSLDVKKVFRSYVSRLAVNPVFKAKFLEPLVSSLS